MTISKTTLTVVSALFSSWFFMDAYFAHAQDLRQVKKDTQIKDWSIEQSLNYMQRTHIRNDLRKELKKPVIKRDEVLVHDLKESNRVLKTRSVHLQNMQDQATLDALKQDDKPSKLGKMFDILIDDE